MTYKTITCEVADGILTLTLNRPEILNAFNRDMLSEMLEVFDRADEDETVHALEKERGSLVRHGHEMHERHQQRDPEVGHAEHSLAARVPHELSVLGEVPRVAHGDHRVVPEREHPDAVLDEARPQHVADTDRRENQKRGGARRELEYARALTVARRGFRGNRLRSTPVVGRRSRRSTR